MTGLHKIWHDDAEPVSEVHRPLKLFFLNSRWRTAVLISQFFDFRDGDHLAFLKLNFLTAVHFRVMFYIIVL